MIKLFTKEEYENAKSTDKLPLKCKQCGKTFYIFKKMITFIEKHNLNDGSFCSQECCHKNQEAKIDCVCSNCGKHFAKTNADFKKSKSGNHFCSKSCAVSYNNKHKKFGIRRSKLEKYLENKLSELYPELEILYNSKEIINSELDVYIPKYKLAFELNGIFHYEPIFGEDKLRKIQNNDKNKFQLCQEHDISLCVIDTSSLKYFKEQNAEKYLIIIKSIINETINREKRTLNE